MSARWLKLRNTRGALWLASALWVGACGEDVPSSTNDEDPGSEEQSDPDDDDSDDERADDDQVGDDDAKPTPAKDAGALRDSSVKLDGSSTVPAAAKDARATSPSADASAGEPDPEKTPDGGAGSTSDASSTGDAAKTRMDLGKGDGKDVITIGDSWMNLITNGGGIERGLLEASGQPYRTYGVAGTKLLDEVIPRQYASAKRADPDIKTVVMTGGGNDLLLTGMSGGSCTSSCMMTIQKVGERLKSLWEEMAKDGVQDVVYIEYSRGGRNGPSVEYGITQVKPVCDGMASLRCHFIDSDEFIMKQLADGIHPTRDGCSKLGKAAFDLMVKEGMRR